MFSRTSAYLDCVSDMRSCNVLYNVPSRELLILHLLADTSSADQAIVLASLAREFTITLVLVS